MQTARSQQCARASDECDSSGAPIKKQAAPYQVRFLVRFAPPLRLVSLNAAQLAPAFDLQTSFDQARCQQLRNEGILTEFEAPHRPS